MKITAEIPNLTPENLAECFWELDDKEQARFFEQLGNLSLATPCPYSKKVGSYFGLDMQMCYAAEKCSGHALRVMEIIGQYGYGEEKRMQPYLLANQKMPEIPVKKGAF